VREGRENGTIGQRHYDCPADGGAALQRATSHEMRTGEGKDLVGTLAGVHERDG